MTDVSVLSNSEAIRFLRWLDPNGRHNLVALDPAGIESPQAATFDFAQKGQADNAAEWVALRNGACNLYFSINEPAEDARPGTKLRRDEIGAVRAFHVDIDSVEQPDWDFDCLPSAIIDSGGGQWGLWKLAEKLPADDVPAIEAQNRALTARFHGDAQAHNLDRIARLPGTLNIPNAAKRKKGRTEAPARIVTVNGPVWERAEVAEWCPPAAIVQADSHSAQPNPAPIAQLDTADNVLACMEYLDQSDLVAVAGEGGRAVTIQALHGCMDRGASPEMAAALCLRHLQTEGEDWTLPELRKLARGLVPSRKSPQGIDAPTVAEVEFADESSGAPPAQPPRREMSLEYVADIEQDLKAEAHYLIRDWYDRGTTIVTYGESNSGKTHVVLDQALAIATGRPWAGKAVFQGLVVYVAAEGGYGLQRRIMAHKRHRPEIDWAKVPFALVRHPIDLNHSGRDAKALIKLVRDAEAKYGQKCAMVVVDTLSRALAGGDENSSADMGQFVKRCDAVRTALGAALHIIHHAGKNTAKGARGHSLLRAAVDTEIEIESNTVISRKQRDAEAPAELRFDYKPVALGVDAEGLEVRSVVLDVWTPTDFDPEMSPQTQKVLEAAQTLISQKMQNVGAENACSETAMLSVKELMESGIPERTIHRSAIELVELGRFIKCKRGLYKLK